MHRILDNDIFLSVRISYDNIKQIPPVRRVTEPQDRHGIRVSLAKQIQIALHHIMRVERIVRRYNVTLRSDIRLGRYVFPVLKKSRKLFRAVNAYNT